MSETMPIRKVIVVGRDESLWLAVHVLWQAFHNTGLDITAVELPSNLRTGDVFATRRNQEAFHNLLGLNEAALMRATQGTFSLGQRFVNWSKTRPPFFHAYGSYGTTIERVPFRHHWLKARAQGMKTDYEDFSLVAAAAKQGRFFIPSEETDDLAEADYAYHLGAASYCGVLKQVALQRAVSCVPTHHVDVRIDAEDGRITSLLLSNGQEIDGDLYIDASGAESLLLGKALGTGFTSWKKWFPCDRILTAYGPAFDALPTFNQVSAFRSGWVGLYPLRDRTAVQQVYTSVDMNEQQALEAATLVSSMRLNSDPIVTHFTAGTRGAYWAKNCVAIGEAAVVLDPIDNVRVQSTLIGLSHLVSLFPLDRDMEKERVEYNRNVTEALECVRDFQIAHYCLNQRFDQPFWDHCGAMEVPDRLKYKLGLFEARGNLAVYDDENFQNDEWVAMMIGHGLLPKAYDPLVDQADESEVIRRFQQILTFIRVNVEKMKPMKAYLDATPAMGATAGL